MSPDQPSHTFAVPELGILVPIAPVPDSAKNPCDFAPCALTNDHRTITFTFRTGKPGHYRWQCFVPCAAGFLYGFGGPMQTLGYMDGFLDVVLTMSTATPTRTPPPAEPSHGRRVIGTWLVVSVIATPLVVWLVGTFIPPGNSSEQATQQVYDNQWIAAVVTPVVLLMLVFFGTRSSSSGCATVTGATARRCAGTAASRSRGSSSRALAVLALAVFGTFELLQNGAGGGQGPGPGRRSVPGAKLRCR